MLIRWIASAVIALLFLLNLALPNTSIGRRGSDDQIYTDVSNAAGEVGVALPAFKLTDITGTVLSSTDLLGHKVLLVFERSLDW